MNPLFHPLGEIGDHGTHVPGPDRRDKLDETADHGAGVSCTGLPDTDGSSTDLPDVRYAGRCPVTGSELSLGPTPLVIAAAQRLQRYLDERQQATDGFRTSHLRQPAAGKMFGVLLCRNAEQHLGTLRAFSGEWERWATPDGWVPSSGHLEEYADERKRTETEVDALTRKIDELKTQPTSKPLRRQIEMIKIERGQLSRALTDRIHAAYRFENALGEILPLTDVDTGSRRPPTGMGDCCAPKLLQAAIRQGLTPLAMVEFWWGAASAMHPRVEGNYYSSCQHKCYPILGFLLRGVAAARVGSRPTDSMCPDAGQADPARAASTHRAATGVPDA